MQQASCVIKKSQKPKLTRQQKAAGLVEDVGRKDSTTYLVPSQSDENKVYEVIYLYGRKYGCECSDFLCRNVEACKHIVAVQLFMEKEKQQRQQQKKDEIDLRAQIGLELERAALRELENKYVLSSGGE